MTLEGFRAIPCFFGIMIKYTHEIDYFISILLDKTAFMEPELVKILTEIKTHGYHQWMLSYDKSLIFTARHRHDNLIVFEESFLGYFSLFRDLETYAEKKLKKFVARKALLHH